MSTLPLTKKQEELWRFIGSCDRSPSFVEMRNALGLESKSGVHRLIEALEERGYVRRIPNRSRTIVATNPAQSVLAGALTSELLAELERRGILLGRAR